MRIITCIFLVLSLNVLAQPPLQQKRDSLNSLIMQAKEDTGKVNLLLVVADTYENSNQDSCIHYLEQARKLSTELNFTRGLYKYHEGSLIVLFTKGEYQNAISHAQQALTIAREIGNKDFEIKIAGNLGIIYQYTGEFDKQLKYSLETMDLMEKRGDKINLAKMYHNVGNAYFNLKQYRKGVEYCIGSLDLYKEIGAGENINRVQASLGQNYVGLNRKDSALYYFRMAVQASQKSGDLYAEGSIYGYMSEVYASESDFQSMRDVSYASLKLSHDLQSIQMLASSLYNVAYAEYFNNNNQEARKYIQEALQLALKDSLKDELRNIYIIQSYITAKDGDFKASLLARGKADSIQEIFINESILKNSIEVERKYESEKKDDQIKLQKAEIDRKTIMNWLLVGSAVTILIISLLGYRNYQQKQKLQQQRIYELETEKQLSATEAVLKGEERERTRLAKDLHDGLGGMLSGIKYSLHSMKGNLIMTQENAQAFERSIDLLDSSIKEMRRVAHNMMPEALVKFGLDTALSDFCNDISNSGAIQVTYQSIDIKDKNIDQTTAVTIYRIVQELLNNTIKHASAKNAIVQLSGSNLALSLTVEDDGKGFDTAILKQSRGIGWDNIQNRVEFLRGKLDVNSSPGKGTSVHIELLS